MTDDVRRIDRCQGCGRFREQSYAGPCPTCGCANRLIRLDISSGVAVATSLRWEKTHERIERDRLRVFVAVGLTIGAPFLGFVLSGWPGVAVGLALGGICFWAGLDARMKVREIDRGRAD